MKVNIGCPNRCVIHGCDSNYQKYDGDIHLFRFPKDIDRCKEWARKCGILDIFQDNLNSLYNSIHRVCSSHFEDKMFKGQLKKRLTDSALPTLQLSQSLHDNGSTITSEQDEQDKKEAAIIEHILGPNIKEELTEQSQEYKIKVELPDIENEDENTVKQEKIEIDVNDQIVSTVKPESTDKLNECEACDETFEKIEINVNDQIISTVKPESTDKLHECAACDETFETDLELKEHSIEDPGCKQQSDIKDEPQDEIEDIYVCSMCDEVYDSKEELINHKKEAAVCHEHKICNKCGVVSGNDFTCTWELEDHLRTAHGVQSRDVLAKCGIQLQINDEDLKSRGKKKWYPCRFCPKLLKRSHLRTRHERIHTGEKPYHCSVCGKSFSSSSNLRDHEAIHSGKKRFSCKFCEKTFICNTNRKRHEKVHTNGKSFKCRICDQYFSSKVLLEEHKGTHSDTPYTCNFCPRSFRTRYNRSRHEKVHSGDKTLLLEKIRPSFLPTKLTSKEDESTVQKHILCDDCPKSFSCDAKLQVHRRIHTGEKPFSCGFCDKSFTTNSILKKHQDIHSGEKPFSCSFCSKSFISNFKRIQHERVHTGEKPYLCRYCDKSFSTFSIANDHEKTHTGERPHTCQICTKTFTRKSSLQTHKRVHTGDKPCTCNVCGKLFSYVSSLRKHERIHSNNNTDQIS